MNNFPPFFNERQKRHALIWLALFHIFIIAASNYLVQIPFAVTLKLTALGATEDFSFHSTWGTLSLSLDHKSRRQHREV